METQTEAIPSLPGIPPGGGTPQPLPNSGGRTFKSTPEQRAKWKEAKQRQKASKLGLPIPPTPSTPSGTANPVPPSSALPGSPAWNPDNPDCPLAGVFKTVIPAIEKFNVRTMVETARKVGDPELERLVEKEAPWNPEAREVLEKTGPHVAARLLNRAGISSENAPEAAFLLTAAGIAVSQLLLSSKVVSILKEKQRAEELRAEQAQKNVQI